MKNGALGLHYCYKMVPLVYITVTKTDNSHFDVLVTQSIKAAKNKVAMDKASYQ